MAIGDSPQKLNEIDELVNVQLTKEWRSINQ